MEEESLPLPTLGDLKGLAIPEPVSNAPQTLGWWILLGLLLLGLLALGVLAWRRWRARRYRREGRAALRALERSLADPTRRRHALAQLPALVKRVALAAWPREAVADLTGEAWLDFLDRSYDGDGFTRGPGRLLPRLAYAEADVDPEGLRDLMRLLDTWMDRHRVRA